MLNCFVTTRRGGSEIIELRAFLLGKSLTEVYQMLEQVFKKDIMSRKQVFEYLGVLNVVIRVNICVLGPLKKN